MQPVGEAFLGRAVDGEGKPIDGGAPIHTRTLWPVGGVRTGALDRSPVRLPFDTGVRALNALTTFGVGQRVGIMAGSGVGKSVLLDMIASGAEAEVVVVTDGQENASREFDRARVNRLVEAKKLLGWDFVFLSADLGAFDDAGGLGVDYAARLVFDKTAEGNRMAWDLASEKISRRRADVAERIEFNDIDRKAASKSHRSA